jgi:hypothetical protein
MRMSQFSENRKNCSKPLNSILSSQQNYRSIIHKVLKDYPDVETFDPNSFLCVQNFCRAKIGQTLLYRDETHLSLEGTKMFSQRFNFISR